MTTVRRGFGAARFALFCAAASLAACGSGDPSGPTAPGGTSSAQLEQQAFDLLNGSRSAEGLPPLGLSVPASEVAREHSAAMRDEGFFGHRGPDGRTLFDRLRDAGLPHLGAAENIGVVTGAADPASWIHGRLMESAEHREHILGESFARVGVGVAVRGDTVWLTQVFLPSD